MPFVSRIRVALTLWACCLVAAQVCAQDPIAPTALIPSDARSLVYLPSVAAFEDQVHTWGAYSEWDVLNVFGVESWIHETTDHLLPLTRLHGLAYARCPSAADSDVTCQVLVIAPVSLNQTEEVYEAWGPAAPPFRLYPYVALNLDRRPVNASVSSPLGCSLPEALLSLRVSGEELFGAPRNLFEKAKLKLAAFRKLQAAFDAQLPHAPQLASKLSKALAFKVLPSIEDVTISVKGEDDRGTIKADCVFREEKALDDLTLKIRPQDQARLLGPLPLDHFYQVLLPTQFYDATRGLLLPSETLGRLKLDPAPLSFCRAVLDSLSGSKLARGRHFAMSWGMSNHGLEIAGVVQVQDGHVALSDAVEALTAKPWRKSGLRWIFGEVSVLDSLHLREATLYVVPGHFESQVSANNSEPLNPVGAIERLFNCRGDLTLQIAASANGLFISVGFSRSKFLKCASGMLAPPSLRFLNEDPEQASHDVVTAIRCDFSAQDRANSWIAATLNGETQNKPAQISSAPKHTTFSLSQTGLVLSFELKFHADPALKRRLLMF